MAESKTSQESEHSQTWGKTILLYAILFILFPLTILGGELEFLGNWPYGSSYTVTKQGNRLYLGNGGVIEVYEVSNPSKPRLITTYATQGLIRKLRIYDEILLAANGEEGVAIFHIGEDTPLSFLRSLSTNGHAFDIIYKDSILYVSAGNGVDRFDLSDPDNPLKLERLLGPDIAGLKAARGMTSVGDYLYVCFEEAGVARYAMDTHIADLISVPGIAVDIATDGDSLYVAADSAGVAVLSMEPFAHIRQFQTSPRCFASRISKVDDVLYIGSLGESFTEFYEDLPLTYENWVLPPSTGDHSPGDHLLLGLHVLDTNGDRFYRTQTPAYEAHIEEDVAYLACGSSKLKILDLTQDPGNTSSIPIDELDHQPWVLAFQGGYTQPFWCGFIQRQGRIELAFSGDCPGKLADVSQEPAPGEVLPIVAESKRGIKIGGVTGAISSDGRYILGAHHISGISITKIEQQSLNTVYFGNPSERLRWWDVASDGDMLYGAGSKNFVLIDISNPAQPRELGRVDLPSSAFQVKADPYRKLAYVGCIVPDPGFAVVDITDPTNPVLKGFGNVGHHVCWGMEVDKRDSNIVYLCATNGGLRIFDTSDPTNPTEIGYFTPEQASSPDFAPWSARLLPNPTLLAVAAGEGGLFIIDVSDPAHPVEVIRQDTPGIAWGIDTEENGLIGIADNWGGGVQVYRWIEAGINSQNSLSPGYKLSQNCPNPFNNITQIHYQLPKSTQVRLCVYNLTGQLVKTLVDQEVSAGSHSVVWDGTDKQGRTVSSGVYIYLFDIEGTYATKQCVLLK